MANCPKCSKFHSPRVKPICTRKDCPIPECHKGEEDASWHSLSREQKWDRDPKAAFLELADEVDRLFTQS